MSQRISQADTPAASPVESQIRDLSFPAIAASVLVVFGMWIPMLFGRIYTSDDLWKYHFPIRKFYADCIARGESFDWMPSVFCGYFLTGSGQAGTYHPLHWVLYKFLPLNIAFNIEITISYPLMLFGMRLFLQRWLRRSDSAWLGGIVFAFSGFCLLHFLHPNAIGVVAHLPWLLYLIDRIIRPTQEALVRAGRIHRNWRFELALMLLTGSQLLLGYPQYVWYSVIAEAVYCLVTFLQEKRTRRTVWILCLLAALKLAGAGLGAVQLLPSIDALQESDRDSIDPQEFNREPLLPWDMLQFVVPYVTSTRVFGLNTHELAVYCGAIPFLLALCGMTRRGVDSSARTLQIWALTTGLIALWLAFGSDAGLYRIQTALPMIGKFRWPSRIAVLLCFCLAALSAMAFDNAASKSGITRIGSIIHQIRQRRWLVTAPSVCLLVSLTSFFWLPESMQPKLGLRLVGPVLSILAALMVLDLQRGICTAGFMLFLVGDLAVYGFTYEALHKTERPSKAASMIDVPVGKPDQGRIFSQTKKGDGNIIYAGNQAVLIGWQLADGYEGLTPRIRFLEKDLTLDSLRLAGVRWVPNTGIYKSIQTLQPSDGSNWLQVPDPLPTLMLTDTVRSVPMLMAPEVAMCADGPTLIDPTTVSEVDAEAISTMSAKAPETDDTLAVPSADSIQVIRDSPGYMKVSVETNAAKLLRWNQRYSSGWRVIIDGIRRPAIRADFDFLATTVSEGQHIVEFEFQPVSLAQGKQISLLTLFFAIMWAMFRRRRLPRQV